MQQISMLQQETLDSREVAEMLEKRHTDLLRDIAKTKDYFTERKIALSDFFQETSFIDATGRKLKNYQITKKGCEFLAHKLTGAKGAAFTAKYIDAFHELQNNLALPSEVMGQVLQIQTKILEQLEKIENRKYLLAAPSGGTTDEIEHLLNRQRKSRKSGKARQLLMETLPPEIRILVDRLLLDKSRNYAFIQKVLAEKGYRVSNSAIRNYYKKAIAKTEVAR